MTETDRRQQKCFRHGSRVLGLKFTYKDTASLVVVVTQHSYLCTVGRTSGIIVFLLLLMTRYLFKIQRTVKSEAFYNL